MHWHRGRLRVGRHHSAALQRAWNKHGEHSFWVSVVEVCKKCQLEKREQFWIDKLNTWNDGYNCYPFSRIGGKPHTESTKQKLREAQQRLCQNPEEREMRRQRAIKMHADGRIPPRKRIPKVLSRPVSKEEHEKRRAAALRQHAAGNLGRKTWKSL